jgi:hypothetical protein
MFLSNFVVEILFIFFVYVREVLFGILYRR